MGCGGRCGGNNFINLKFDIGLSWLSDKKFLDALRKMTNKLNESGYSVELDIGPLDMPCFDESIKEFIKNAESITNP